MTGREGRRWEAAVVDEVRVWEVFNPDMAVVMRPGPNAGGRTLVDSRAAAVAAGVRPSTVRAWLSRGLLERYGTDSRRRTLVDLAEVQALAVRRRNGKG